MAPTYHSKRTRALDGDTEIYEDSPSSFQQSRKRARLSAFDGDDDSASQWSDQVNGSAEQGSDDEALIEAATQRLVTAKLAHSRGTRNNYAADNAIIEEVVCIHFMCHERLTVKLGPLINFIIGHNGSGKSAVLTAITLCLGGKATATNRGQSLKGFIKEGHDSAMLSVRLKNQGSGAFKPELYGSSVVVERHFTKSGSSGFKLKNERGRTISTKKADLEDILDAFSLQLDNPLTVLTQDMARQFLNHSTPTDKFRFFMQGTQLEQLDRDYRLVEDNLNQCEDMLVTEKEDEKVLQREYEQADRKAKLAQRQQQIRDQIDYFGAKMAWAQVAEQETILAQYEESIQQLEEEAAGLTNEAEKQARKHQDADRLHRESQQKEQEIRDSLGPLQEEERTTKEAFNAKRQEQLDAQHQQREIRQGIVAKRNTIKKYEDDIEAERQRLAYEDGGQNAKLLEELESAKAHLEDAQTTLRTHDQGFKQLDINRHNANKMAKDEQPKAEAKREELQACESLIRSLSRDQGGWVQAYDRDLPKLLDLIRQERGFREPPIGPIGRYIQLLKPEWSSVLEKTFGGLLNGFVVTSKHDEVILSNLVRRTNYNGLIYIGEKNPIDTSQYEPDPELETTMRILKIENDLVRNQLIINQAIEQTVLIRDRNEAVRFMFPNEGSGRQRPKKVKVCLCVQDDRRGGFRLSYTSVGADRMDNIEPWGRRPRMQTSMETQINIERVNQRRLSDEVEQAVARLKHLNLDVRRCDQAIASHRQRGKELELAVQRAQEEIERLTDELEAASPQAGKLEELERRLQSELDHKAVLENSYQDAVNARDQVNRDNADLKHRLDEILKDIKKVEAHLQKAIEKSARRDQARHLMLIEKNQVLEKINVVKAQKAEFEESRNQQLQTVESFIEEASQVSPRVEILEGETARSLDRKLAQLVKDLEVCRRQAGGDEQDLIRITLEAKNKLEEHKRIYTNHERVAQTLKSALVYRQHRWHQFRKLISSRARCTFGVLLSKRNFRGNLLIDPNSKQIDLRVEPDISRESDRGRQTKTLSGGEKSFSTICFLLSIWEAMGSQIRCLDEFDVFMDNVNRDISMRMLIEAARSSVSRQFIFITPQAMGNVQMADDVKIIKMSDPERGQTTLPFTRT